MREQDYPGVGWFDRRLQELPAQEDACCRCGLSVNRLFSRRVSERCDAIIIGGIDVCVCIPIAALVDRMLKCAYEEVERFGVRAEDMKT